MGSSVSCGAFIRSVPSLKEIEIIVAGFLSEGRKDNGKKTYK